MKDLELLSPAGNMVSLRAAVENGADSVYMGLNNFNARVMANNFTKEEYIEAIKYCHLKGVKVFLTLNTLVNDEELKEALESLLELYKYGLDAVIVQDYGLAMAISKIMPELPIHASTQMSIHNLKQVKFLEKLGFKRVVLARELTVEQIEEICKNTTMEVEVFIHGALCVCYSGQCLMSAMIGNRSGNRGSCAQPCRMKYTLLKDDKVIEKDKYLLSKKDIFGLDYIKKLKEAGVYSLKIEGRNKVPEYVATVTKTYRRAIDDEKITNDERKELLQIFNRSGESLGYFEGVTGKESITINTPKNTGLKLGKVLGQKGKFVNVILEEDIYMQDGIEIYSQNSIVSTIVTCIKDDNGKTINTKVAKGTSVWLGDINAKVKYESAVYKTSSNELNKRLQYTFNTVNSNIKKSSIKAVINICKAKEITVDITSNNGEKHINYISNIIPEKANKKGITEDIVIDAFNKTGDEPFYFEQIEVKLDEGLYLSIANLNKLRKASLEMLKKEYEIIRDITSVKNNYNKFFEQLNLEQSVKYENTKIDSIMIYKYEKDKKYAEYLKGIQRIYFNFTDMLKYKEDIVKYIKAYEVYLVIPNIVESSLDKLIDRNLEEFLKLGIKGILIGNVGYFDLLNELKLKYNINIIGDYSLNIMNTCSVRFFASLGLDKVTLSPELSEKETLKLSKEFNIEVISGKITVMSSRYCMLGSFIGNKTIKGGCTRPCMNGKYSLVDTKGEKYTILSDNIDSIMKIIKEYNPSYSDEILRNVSIRKNIL